MRKRPKGWLLWEPTCQGGPWGTRRTRRALPVGMTDGGTDLADMGQRSWTPTTAHGLKLILRVSLTWVEGGN